MSMECVLKGSALRLTLLDLSNGVLGVEAVRAPAPLPGDYPDWEPMIAPMPARVRDAVNCALLSLGSRSMCAACAPPGRCLSTSETSTDYLVG